MSNLNDALRVEDGSGVTGANSYTDADRAGAYHAQRGTQGDWQALADSGYDVGLLIEATRQIDALYSWRGTIATTTQGLALPRQDMTLEDGRVLSGAAQVALASDAVAWLALRLYSDQTSSGYSTAQSESLGSYSATYGAGGGGGARKDYGDLDHILAPIVDGGGFNRGPRNVKLVRWS